MRTDQPRAFIEGIFSLDQASDGDAVRELLAEFQLLDEEDQLIVAREIARGGRSVARVNGRAVPLAVLQQVGEHLVDIHGQSQHLSLLRPREHLEYLDRFASLVESRRRVAQLVGHWRELKQERRKLVEEIRLAARERELLRHEVAEIEAADLRVGEEEELALLRQRLRHVVRLREAAEQAIVALQGTDEQRGAIDLLGEAGVQCQDAARADAAIRPLAETVEQLAAEAEEASRDLKRYLEQLETDPRQLELVEARFLSIADLKRKYGESVESILVYLDQAKTRLTTAERGEELLADLDEQARQVEADLTRAAVDLSRRRADAIGHLSTTIERELADLQMRGARFSVSIERQPDPDGILWQVGDGEPFRVAVDASGADRVEFLFSANRGEPPRGLGRIASGGELARVALALKSVLAQVDRRDTLVFDEIDVGVGGRSAAVVGQKLWELTRSHQVLCITHMPQVAAFADDHLVVTKRETADRTGTIVETVTGPKRVAELAAMLGGAPGSKAAEANARELLAASERAKRAARDARKAG